MDNGPTGWKFEEPDPDYTGAILIGTFTAFLFGLLAVGIYHCETTVPHDLVETHCGDLAIVIGTDKILKHCERDEITGVTERALISHGMIRPD